MTSQPDLIVYSRDGRMIAVVAIRNKRGASRAWAAQMRSNFISEGRFGTADFLLLATPDRVYLWKPEGKDPALIPPDYEVDGKALFAPYLEMAGLNPESFSANAFELIVGNWLSSLILGIESDAAAAPPLLAESDFLKAVRGGRTEHQLAA
jgi:hypothetical protein